MVSPMANFTLPPGWTMKTVTRKSGKTAGRVDKYYYSPSGKRYRSMKKVMEVAEPVNKVWYRDPSTKRLVRVKTVEKIDVGSEVEEVFKSQSVKSERWSILKSLASVFSWA